MNKINSIPRKFRKQVKLLYKTENYEGKNPIFFESLNNEDITLKITYIWTFLYNNSYTQKQIQNIINNNNLKKITISEVNENITKLIEQILKALWYKYCLKSKLNTDLWNIQFMSLSETHDCLSKNDCLIPIQIKQHYIYDCQSISYLQLQCLKELQPLKNIYFTYKIIPSSFMVSDLQSPISLMTPNLYKATTSFEVQFQSLNKEEFRQFTIWLNKQTNTNIKELKISFKHMKLKKKQIYKLGFLLSSTFPRLNKFIFSQIDGLYLEFETYASKNQSDQNEEKSIISQLIYLFLCKPSYNAIDLVRNLELTNLNKQQRIKNIHVEQNGKLNQCLLDNLNLLYSLQSEGFIYNLNYKLALRFKTLDFDERNLQDLVQQFLQNLPNYKFISQLVSYLPEKLFQDKFNYSPEQFLEAVIPIKNYNIIFPKPLNLPNNLQNFKFQQLKGKHYIIENNYDSHKSETKYYLFKNEGCNNNNQLIEIQTQHIQTLIHNQFQGDQINEFLINEQEIIFYSKDQSENVDQYVFLATPPPIQCPEIIVSLKISINYHQTKLFDQLLSFKNLNQLEIEFHTFLSDFLNIQNDTNILQNLQKLSLKFSDNISDKKNFPSMYQNLFSVCQKTTELKFHVGRNCQFNSLDMEDLMNSVNNLTELNSINLEVGSQNGLDSYVDYNVLDKLLVFQKQLQNIDLNFQFVSDGQLPKILLKKI